MGDDEREKDKEKDKEKERERERVDDSDLEDILDGGKLENIDTNQDASIHLVRIDRLIYVHSHVCPVGACSTQTESKFIRSLLSINYILVSLIYLPTPPSSMLC